MKKIINEVTETNEITEVKKVRKPRTKKAANKDHMTTAPDDEIMAAEDKPTKKKPGRKPRVVKAVEPAEEIKKTPQLLVEPGEPIPLEEGIDMNAMEASNTLMFVMKAAVSMAYDAQAARIATSNRIVNAVKRANGMIDNTPKALREETTSAQKEEKENTRFINTLMEEYYLIKSNYEGSTFMNETKFRRILAVLGDKIKYTNNLFVYHMMGVYNNQLGTEMTMVKTIAQMVDEHPIWDGFLKDVVGCGPLMAAVCIAYLDPYKARHASSFWRYAGLDVVFEPFKKEETSSENFTIDPNDPLGSMEGAKPVTSGNYFTKHIRVEWNDGREVYEDNVFDAIPTETEIKIVTVGRSFSLPMQEKDTVIKANKRNGLLEDKIVPGAKIIDFDVTDLEVPVEAPEGRYVGRAKRHVVDVQYVNKNGETATKKSISYNPILKTKLVGVLADSFIKCPGSKYEQVYRGYRHRLDCSAKHVGLTAAHKHMMAKRYCIKMFLADLWVAWRTLEGLPVSEPYAVAVLGRNPHGFNYDSEK